jgi:hypothetical protein
MPLEWPCFWNLELQECESRLVLYIWLAAVSISHLVQLSLLQESKAATFPWIWCYSVIGRANKVVVRWDVGKNQRKRNCWRCCQEVEHACYVGGACNPLHGSPGSTCWSYDELASHWRAKKDACCVHDMNFCLVLFFSQLHIKSAHLCIK